MGDKARSAGAEAVAEVVEAKGDNSKQIGAAICDYAGKAKADAVMLMRHTKKTVTRIFMGSVTHYCAVHSPTPVIIVPNYA
ncbi:g5260 [Coccomyxa elongata]